MTVLEREPERIQLEQEVEYRKRRNFQHRRAPFVRVRIERQLPVTDDQLVPVGGQRRNLAVDQQSAIDQSIDHAVLEEIAIKPRALSGDSPVQLSVARE